MAWSELMSDNGIVAWGVAFLLAVGGTAVVVAAWLQFRSSWKSLPAGLKRRIGTAPKKAAVRTPTAPAAERPRKSRDPRQAVQAYQGQAQASPPQATPAPAPQPRPAAPRPAAPAAHALSMEDLDAYLTRLHKAVDELEAAAGAPS